VAVTSFLRNKRLPLSFDVWFLNSLHGLLSERSVSNSSGYQAPGTVIFSRISKSTKRQGGGYKIQPIWKTCPDLLE
jgi:hypothetical protein